MSSTSHRAKRKSRAVGILVEGDPCPGTDALIAAAAAAAWQFGWEARGIEGGFEGLLRRKPRQLDAGDMERRVLLSGPSRRGSTEEIERHADLRRVVHGHGLAGLIAIGGLATMERAERVHRRDVAVVGIPKALENDVSGTALAFGFDTVVAAAVDALERLRDTARPEGRVIIAEVSGRSTGWVALHAGLAAGAAAILIPEIPSGLDRLCEAVRARERFGARPASIVVAEGVAFDGVEPQAGAAERVAAAVGKRLKRETRSIALTTMQLGGPPSAFDRLLAARLGSAAMRLVNEGLFGNMVALKASGIVALPLHQVTGRPRTVPLDSDLVRSARELGIGFGD